MVVVVSLEDMIEIMRFFAVVGVSTSVPNQRSLVGDAAGDDGTAKSQVVMAVC